MKITIGKKLGLSVFVIIVLLTLLGTATFTIINNNKEHLDFIGNNLENYIQENRVAEIIEISTLINDELTGLVKINLSIIGVSILFSIIFIVSINRSFRNSILEMASVAEEYAQGDLRNELSEEVKNRTDELGQLSSAINKIQDNFLDVLWKIKDDTQSIGQLAQSFALAAEETSKAANQVAGVIAEVAKGTEKQIRATDQTVTVMENMSQDIQNTSQNTQYIFDLSKQTADLALKGENKIKDVITQMQDIEQNTGNVADIIYKLGDDSKRIGEIVTTISSIAEQTNLLALNAAIEAARAGEHGRGFAVVAEEVRKLAEQSQEATDNITNLIGSVQHNIDGSVKAMEEDLDLVKSGTQLSLEAEQAFVEIKKSINNMAHKVEEISSFIKQIADNSEDIVNQVKNIDTVSKEISSGTQTVSAATEEQAATMQELAASSEALTRTVETLENEVKKFILQER